MFQFNKRFKFISIAFIILLAASLTNAAASAQGNDDLSGTSFDTAIAAQQSGPASGIRYEPVGYVTVPNLNVRSGPSVNYPRLAVAHQRQALNLLGRNAPASWLRVRLGHGPEGWVMARYISASADDIAHLPVVQPEPAPIPVEAIGYVTSYRLNVRVGPGLNQAIIGNVWRGEQVTLLGRNTSGNWLQIKLSGYSKGWVSSQYIQSSVPIYTLPVTEVDIPEPPPVYTGVVTAHSLNVRTGPGFNYPISGRLSQGQQVTLYGRDVSGAWFKIGLPNGAQGWAAAQYIQLPVAANQLKVL